MLTFLVIIVGMLLTGGFAFYVARNVEHGEARFGPDGKVLPTQSLDENKKDAGVTIKRNDTQDRKTND